MPILSQLDKRTTCPKCLKHITGTYKSCKSPEQHSDDGLSINTETGNYIVVRIKECTSLCDGKHINLPSYACN